MKALRILALLTLICVVGKVNAQEKGEINLADSTGMPGDNFSLQGALELFKKSKSLEEFEKQLNDKENAVNNLDLDGDGKTDYVRVIDNTKESVHAIVLQVPVSKTENQDIAVLELERDGDKSAFIQIVGNEEVYGEEKIVEPAEDVEPADNGGTKKGPAAFSPGRPAIFVNVWFWPCVPFLFAPTYVVWVSPWYWGYYPPYWSPWPPYPWRYHYMSCSHYHHHYHYHDFHRSSYAHQVYAPRRSSSPQVNNRYKNNRENYRTNISNRPRNGYNNGTPGKTRPTNVTPGSNGNSPGRPSKQPTTRPDSRPDISPGKTPSKQPPTSRPQTQPSKRPNHQTSRPQTTRPQTSRPPSKPSRPSQPSRQGGHRTR